MSLPRSNICSNKMTDQGPWHIPGSSDTTLSLSRHWHSFPQLPPEPVSGVWTWPWSLWFNLPARHSRLTTCTLLNANVRVQRQAETRNTAWLSWPDTQCMSRAYIIRLETHPIWVWSHCPPSPETVHHGDTETKAIQSQAQSLCPGCVHSDQAQIMDGTSGIRGQVIGCYGYIVAFDMIYKYKDNGQSLRWHQEKVHLHNRTWLVTISSFLQMFSYAVTRIKVIISFYSISSESQRFRKNMNK